METGSCIQNLTFAVAAVITCTVGITLHLFVVTVNVSDWMRGQLVTTTDQLLTLTGMTRIIYQSVSIIDIFCCMFLQVPMIYIDIVDFIQHFSFYTNNCFTSLLSVVFCLKISNFHNAVFLRLKGIILRRMVHLMIISVVLSVFYSLQYLFIIKSGIRMRSSNETYTSKVQEINLSLYVLWNIVPLLAFLIPTVVLIISLCLHINQISGRTVSGHLDTYSKTIKFMSFSFCCYLLYFGTTVAISLNGSSFGLAGMYFCVTIFPTLHSIYLIYVSSKLKDHLPGILQHGFNCLITKKMPNLRLNVLGRH